VRARWLISFIILGAVNVSATVRYVNVNNSTPTSPYTNWASAATVIQDAIDIASAGDVILVTNGVYQTGGHAVNGYTLTNRVAVTIPVTVQSVNGPAGTAIWGYSAIGSRAVRCVYLTNNAALNGFTLKYGATRNAGDWLYEESGGGVLCEATSAVLSNCTITSNSAQIDGGGVYSATLNNCTLSGNSAGQEGGGAFSCTLNNCTVSANSAIWGGGAMYGTLNNCTVSGNSASGTSLGISTGEGGGVYDATLTDCLVSNNSTAIDGGGASYGTLVNCLIVGNRGLQGGGTAGALLVNCTVVGNSVSSSQSLTFGGGSFYDSVVNSILVYNTSSFAGPNYYGSTLSNCCTAPDPGSGGNITNDPAFVNPGGGNYRLQTNSPCINSGNNGYVATTTDLDGNPRIVGGTVDIGAYEFQTPTSIISYAWLQQYGLPTDGSADFTDPDGDGMNNWQEWIAGTDPTNAQSVLRIVQISAGASGTTLTWQSSSSRTYFIQRSTGMGAPSSFQPLASNIVGQAGTTTFTDTNVVPNASVFYRVGVQQ
jgi:hypothetical protein